MLSVGAERLLHTSGVVPIAPDGQVPEGLAEQAETVWANLGAILAEAGMTIEDVVSMTTYVVQGEELAPHGGTAVAYLTASFVGGLAAAMAGFALVRVVRPRIATGGPS